VRSEKLKYVLDFYYYSFYHIIRLGVSQRKTGAGAAQTNS